MELLFNKVLLEKGNGKSNRKESHGSQATSSTANWPLVLSLFWISRKWAALESSGSKWLHWPLMGWSDGLIEDGRCWLTRPHPGVPQARLGERQDLKRIAQSSRPLICFWYCKTVPGYPVHSVLKLLSLSYVVCGTHFISFSLQSLFPAVSLFNRSPLYF